MQACIIVKPVADLTCLDGEKVMELFSCLWLADMDIVKIADSKPY